MEAKIANLVYRLLCARRCLRHAWDNDVPIVRRHEWVVFAAKALYIPLGRVR